MVKKLLLIPLIIYVSLISPGCVSLIKSYKSDTYLKKWEAFADKRQYDRAEAALIKSLKYNQKNTEAWVALGDVYFTIENYEGARQAYKEALKYDRDAFGAYAGLWAVKLEESGYSEKAKEEVEIDIEVFMNSGDKGPERLMAAFRGFSFLHKNERTAKIAEEIISLNPDEEIRATLSNYLSENILPEKDIEKRLKMTDDFLSLFPSGKERRMVRSIRMSIAAEDLKDKERLFQFGEEWIKDEPDNRRANFSVGHWYTKKDVALEMAISYLKKALILINNPDPADKPEHYPDTEWHKDLKKAKGTYYDTLGWAYYKLGRYKDAEKAYKRGVKLLEYDKDLYYHQGLLLEENGEIYGAIDSYVQAHQSGENKEAGERLMALYPFIKGRTAGLDGLLVEEPPNKFFAKKAGVTSFTDITKEAGLSEAGASRVAWGDYNNDGYEDILFNGAVLFKNNGNGTFTDVTKDAGIGGITGANGGLWGDFNNDGDIDFYTFASGKGSTDRFWRNNGDGTFTDITPTTSADPDTLPAEAAAWGDYDNDGLIDIYIANYEKPLSESVARARCQKDRLIRNNGTNQTVAPAFSSVKLTTGMDGIKESRDRPEGLSLPAFIAGSFSDMSAIAGTVSLEKMCGRGVNWGDYDNDGDLDIYVANYRLDPNFLWRNNGDGTFTNVAAEAGVEGKEVEGYFGHSIGAEWGDYDNDGDLDLFVSNLAHPRYIGISNKSMLLENQGPQSHLLSVGEENIQKSPPFSVGEENMQKSPPPSGGRERVGGGFRFINRFGDSGIRFEETSADPSFADYDNDGILDLYFTSTYKGAKSFLYRGKGDGTFTDVTWLAGVRVDDGWGNAFADYDNDGDLDLIVVGGEGVRLFRNDGNDNHWFHVRVVGKESNRAGIGARVTVVPTTPNPLPPRGGGRELALSLSQGWEGIQIREVQGGKGSGSQHSLPVEFGLGNYSGHVDVEVRFPSGKIIRLPGVNTDQMIVVEE